jgi:hypothetical protein
MTKPWDGTGQADTNTDNEGVDDNNNGTRGQRPMTRKRMATAGDSEEEENKTTMTSV